MSDDLKPCPFCGGNNLKSGGDDKIVGVWCRDCQATGPNHYITGADWNVRADRIEELEAKLATCKKYRDAYAECDRISTHALRKAVEALEKLADCVDDGCFCSEMEMATAMDNARTTLAELKGQDDE